MRGARGEERGARGEGIRRKNLASKTSLGVEKLNNSEILKPTRLFEGFRFSVLDEIYCGFADFGDFLRGFAVSNRPLRPPPPVIVCCSNVFVYYLYFTLVCTSICTLCYSYVFVCYSLLACTRAVFSHNPGSWRKKHL